MSTANLVGQTLGGRYQIQSLIGQGGMASVYKAYDPNLRRAVAIKVIHPHLSNNPEFFRRFEEEATAVAHLRHANIVQVYDFNHDGDLYYMVMEFVLGETLQTRLNRLNASRRRLGIKEVVSLTAEICDAAFYAHQRGMIHRDIKPANIMLDVNGRAILMDFGIARMVGASQHTATGAVLGTAMYMSPEQIQGIQTDARADIYSIGVTLFEMLSGRPPFEADSAMTLMMMHLNDPVPDLNELHPNTPPELVEINNKALAKNRDERYQSAKEMADALRRLPEPPQKAQAVVIQPSQPKPAPTQETIIEPRVEKDAGETIIEPAASIPAEKTTSQPLPTPIAPASTELEYQATLVEQSVQPAGHPPTPATPAPTELEYQATLLEKKVKPAMHPPTPAASVPADQGYQATLVEQKVQPALQPPVPSAEPVPQKMPVERKKSSVWIPVISVLLLVVIGGGGYFVYSKFFAGGSDHLPSPTATAPSVALLPSPTIPEPTLTLMPTLTVMPTLQPTAIELPPTMVPWMVLAAGAHYTCTDPIGCVKIGPADPIHIAYLLAVEGPNAAIGVDSRNGVEIAIADAGGKLLNHPIRFDGEDGGCTGEGGQVAGNKLASDSSIVAVIGTSCSNEAQAALPLLSAAGFVIVSSSNTSPDLTNLANPSYSPGFFRTAYNDLIQGAAAADFVYNFLKFTKVATIDDGSIYSDRLAGVFRNEFTKLGGVITGVAQVDPGSTEMSSTLSGLAGGNPQLIYFPIYMPAGAILIEQAKSVAGLENTRLMGADGLFSPDVMNTAGTSIERFMVTSPVVQGAEYDRFLEKYQAMFNTTPMNIFHAHAYDAFNILKAAIQKVAVQEADGTIYIPRQALRDAMATTRDFKGLTGSLTCNINGECASPVMGVYEYHEGQYPPQLIWSEERTAPITPMVTVIGGADKIAFISGKNVWVANLDGSQLTQLTQDNTNKNYLRWLPDGQGLTYISGKCIETVSLSGNISKIACFNNADKLEGFEVSPDGAQVAIGLDSQVYLVPFDLGNLSTAYSHDSLSALATCAQMAPYTHYSAHYVRWSKDSTHWALVAQIPYQGVRADVVAIFPVDRCYTDIYPAIEVQFPPPHFTFSGYDKNPFIQDLAFDGNSLFVLHGITRNDGFGDLHVFNTETFKFSERVNPINGSCCYRDAQFSPDGSYLVFAYQDINLGVASTTQLYYIPFGTIGTGEQYVPLPLPPITDPRERPQPVLRPAVR